jgi:DNA mismatch repair protein MutL
VISHASIRILPPAVAAGIAAGEVIERPASVVKELIENSLDAGASSISIEIKQGGLQSIRVVDDGSGIASDEVALAFERHATSKLGSLDDLGRIVTMGFRGEALASIAAASHVRLVSRTRDADVAAFVEIEGTELLRTGSEAAAPGTSVLVEALFSTIPARLKFIRSSGAETGRVKQVVEHLAMACPHVRFSLRSDERVLVQTSGNGELRDAVSIIHGADMSSAMIEVRPSNRAPHPVHGLVAPPDHNRPNRTGISLFVNGRWVVSAALNAAVHAAYAGLLMEGRYPVAVLFLDVPPGEVDPNVHPNKREVRFSREGDAFSSIERAVREALIEANPIAQARGEWARGGSPPPAPRSPQAFDFTLAPDIGAWAPLPEPAPDAEISVSDGELPQQVISGMPELRVLGQIANAYIVAEGADGMYLIDQHAAHESVLYYRLLRQWQEHQPEVQPMLEPLPIELNPEQIEALAQSKDDLDSFGLSLEPFGETTWLLRSVPAMARRVDGAKLVAEVLDRQRTGGDTTATHTAIAASIACHSAVRAGQGLDQQELEALGHALAIETDPHHCPHGRPTTIRVTMGMLEREFGRA